MMNLNLDNLNLGITDEVAGEATGVNDLGSSYGLQLQHGNYISNAFIWTAKRHEKLNNLNSARPG